MPLGDGPDLLFDAPPRLGLARTLPGEHGSRLASLEAGDDLPLARRPARVPRARRLLPPGFRPSEERPELALFGATNFHSSSASFLAECLGGTSSALNVPRRLLNAARLIGGGVTGAVILAAARVSVPPAARSFWRISLALSRSFSARSRANSDLWAEFFSLACFWSCSTCFCRDSFSFMSFLLASKACFFSRVAWNNMSFFAFRVCALFCLRASCDKDNEAC
mmetsp:Transcript_24855/g.71871  ORF Transcript_24855/g.71871 Transcript_24855/m.71871 type:complete len:223 (+) Transcript_24855:919-1587(+)